MRLMIDTAAGVRLRFTTTAERIELTLAVHPLEIAPSGPLFPAFVDLVVDDRVIRSERVEGTPARLDVLTDTLLPMEPSPAQVVTFAGLPAGEKTAELWLPHTAVVDLYTVAADRPITPAPPDARPRWLHHGSSISHGMEAPRPTGTWPAVAAAAAGLDLLDLAYAGNAMLDPFVAQAIREADADLISLKIGINLVNADAMRTRAFVPAVHGFLDTIREGHPSTPILLISPISCPIVEDRPGPTGMGPDGIVKSLANNPIPPDALTLERIRRMLAAVVDDRRSSDANLTYLDGRALFDERDVDAGLLPDALHPNEEGHRLMGERFADLLPSVAPPLRLPGPAHR